MIIHFQKSATPIETKMLKSFVVSGADEEMQQQSRKTTGLGGI